MEENKEELVDNAVNAVLDQAKVDEATTALKKAKEILESNEITKHAAIISFVDTGTVHGFISEFLGLETLDNITTYLLDYASKLIKDTARKTLENQAAAVKERIKEGDKDNG